MLRIDLTALRKGPVATAAEIPRDGSLFQDLGFVLSEPVHLRGRLTQSGPARYYWRAELSTTITTTCRRCLTPVTVPVCAAVNVFFAEDIGSDDASVYAIPPRSTELDLSGAVREELILALPEYVVCSEDCRGICAGCGTDLNKGACRCRPDADARWSALAALKTARPNDGR